MDEKMSDEEFGRTCTGCGVTAPATETTYTLISTEHGWRLRRYTHGRTVVCEWWCSTCWLDLKKSSGGGITLNARSTLAKKIV